MIGNGSFFLTGSLGSARVYSDIVQETGDLNYINAFIAQDLPLVQQAITAVGPTKKPEMCTINRLPDDLTEWRTQLS